MLNAKKELWSVRNGKELFVLVGKVLFLLGKFKLVMDNGSLGFFVIEGERFWI